MIQNKIFFKKKGKRKHKEGSVCCIEVAFYFSCTEMLFYFNISYFFFPKRKKSYYRSKPEESALFLHGAPRPKQLFSNTWL